MFGLFKKKDGKEKEKENIKQKVKKAADWKDEKEKKKVVNPHTGKKVTDAKAAKCPVFAMKAKRVPLSTLRGSHVASQGTKDLVADIGGGDRIRSMCTRFYEKAFEDSVLSRFMFEDDGAKAHGKRLGDWIIEKMGAGTPWTDSGRYGIRSHSHARAWYSDKREPEKRGRRFKLDDCRIWMRLMFWAAREEGLYEHQAFFEWYTKFIGHFIRVYERTAPPYTKESAEWSESKENIEDYIKNKREMIDVIDYQAEVNDEWLYFT
mmetsp:Transcript_8940/g.13362  ORF Transcript_8940/g.13362 Transcript_8940/m.13362 type:complete len:263 (-) Transcript_8940:266-1054(-)